MNTAENSFLLDAEKVCRIAMKESHGLIEALQSCEGLFPTLAMPHFSRLNNALMNRWIADAELTQQTEDPDDGRQESFPLSTWIFSDRSRRELSKVLWDGSVRVCLLGVPSLVELLPDLVGTDRHLLIDLLDSHAFNPEQVSKLSYDINFAEWIRVFRSIRCLCAGSTVVCGRLCEMDWHSSIILQKQWHCCISVAGKND